MDKVFNLQNNIGSVKYAINYHDGIKTHKDGSPFFDIATFKSKVKRDIFIKNLIKEGYNNRMKHPKEYYQKLHQTKDLKGYQWFGYFEGVKGQYLHHFKKKDTDSFGWLEIKATEENLENGDIEFMTLNDLSK